MTEIFKIKNKLAPPIKNSIFERRNEPDNLTTVIFKKF